MQMCKLTYCKEMINKWSRVLIPARARSIFGHSAPSLLGTHMSETAPTQPPADLSKAGQIMSKPLHMTDVGELLCVTSESK